ncbi:MAG TPA: hypothetical protein PLL44_04180 [Novosphingobium sp.]|jgi:hypothetical protein|nr:hypothetical protein [Novosphingobium sp.]HOA48990.1 hypothetical protein [Novosphingobium sp.]HPB22306.1 hypothetical protein [Novosphingobium sp.]HPZ47177.1 hypothetical protein [Novosphingobium sp.]HQD99648.1 hypothetical protein [Novosphingobium sp.]
MVIATELFSRMSGPADSPPQDAEPRRFDWHGLHARLAAAHAARGALRGADSGPAAASGGFAALRVGERASRGVNPTDLADRKAAAANDWVIAGQAMTGGRGQ